MDASSILLCDFGVIGDILQILIEQIPSVGGIGLVLYFCIIIFFLMCCFHFVKCQFLPKLRRNGHFSEHFRPQRTDSTERVWRSYQEGTESSEDLPSFLISHKAKVSEKRSIRHMLCGEPCCEVCNSLALEADLLFESPLPELASWTLQSDLSLNLPSNLNLVPSPSHSPVASDPTSLNPSSSMAASTLPGHTTSIAPIHPMDLNFTLPPSSTSALTTFQTTAPIMVQSYSQSSTTSRTHISVLAHTSTVVCTTSMSDTSLESVPSVVLAPQLVPPLPEALTSSLQPNNSLTSSVVQTPSMAPVASNNPSDPETSTPSPIPGTPQESASQYITHPSLKDVQSVNITLSLAPTPPVAPPPSIFPIPIVTPTPSIASALSNSPTSSLNSTLPITPTLSFAPGHQVAPVPPIPPSPFVAPEPYFAPIPSVTPTPHFAPTPFFAPSPFFAPTPSFAPAPVVTPALSVASIPPIAQTSTLDHSFLIDPTYVREQPQIFHSPYEAHTTSLNPSYSRTSSTSVASTSSLSSSHSPTSTSSKARSMAPIFSRRTSFSSPSTSATVPLKISTPIGKHARTSRFHASSIAPRASISHTSSLASPTVPKVYIAHTSSMARTLEENLSSSVVHDPSLVHMPSMVYTTQVTSTGSISHTPSQASTSPTICTPSLVHTPLVACTSFTTPTTSLVPTFSQASPPLQEKICSQILRSSLLHTPPEEAHIHSTAQSTSVEATSLEETASSQVLRFSLAGGIPVDHNPSRAHVTNTESLNITSPVYIATPSRKPLMRIKDPPIFLSPTSLVDFQLPQQSSLTPRPPNPPLAPATCGKPDVLGTTPRVLSTDEAPLMTSAPLTSDIDESCATFLSHWRNSQGLMLPYLLLWGSQVEPLSLGPSEAYLCRQNRELKGTLSILVPEKPSDHKTSEQQEKTLVPLRLQLSEQAKNARAKQHPEANQVPLLSSSAQEFLEIHITEKRALHIWKEKELLSQATADLPPCFQHRELKKLSLLLEDTEPSVKDLWTPDPQCWSADQPFLGSEKSFVNNMKPEQISIPQQLYTPLSLNLAPSTLHFLNRLCSMPGWGPDSTVNHNQQYIQLFWGLPSLHSESLATFYMGSSSSSRQEASIKLPPGDDNPLIFFNDFSYLDLSNSANQPTQPSPTQNFNLLPKSYSTSSQPPSLPPTPPLSPIQPPPPPPTPQISLYPFPSPSLPSSPTQIRTFKTDPEETSIWIPSIDLPKFQALEWHLLQKQLQSLWGVPHIVQRSYEAFHPLPLQLPKVPKSPFPQVAISNWPHELPFLSKDVKKLLETHLRRRLVQHRWGLARRIEDSIKHLVPQTIPQQDSAKSKKSKTSTFQDLKHSGKRDTASDSAAVLGGVSGIITETSPTMHSKESPKNNLEKSPSSSQQETLQKHLLKKSIAIQQKVVPESVSRSWATARYQSITLQTNQIPHRQQKMKRIVPKAPYMEDKATQTQLQTWPKSQIQPQPQFHPQTPSPTEEVIYQVEPCKDIPFLSPETKKLLESHIRHMHIQLKWGLPKNVLKSIYLFKLKNPLSQILPPHWPDIRIREGNLQDFWVGGVAREASAAVLDILEAEKSSWNTGKELGTVPQAGGDWEENMFSPGSCLMGRGPRQHMTEMGSRRKILELKMKHPALLPNQKDLAPSFSKKLKGKEKQEQRVIPLIEENERADESQSICFLQSPCASNKAISCSKLNFHLKKRMVEKGLGIPLRVRESREMVTRRQLQLPSFVQLEVPLVAEVTDSFPGTSHEREIKDDLANGEGLSLNTLDTQDLSSLILKEQLTNEEVVHPRVVEQSCSESHTSKSLVYSQALGFQAPEVPQPYSLRKLNENVTGSPEPGPLVKLKRKSPSLREYQKLQSQLTRKNQAKFWVQSQTKGNLSKSIIDQEMGDGQENNLSLMKDHTSDCKWLSQVTMSRVLELPKPEGILQHKIPSEIRIAEKMKGFLRWICPKKKIKGSEESFPREEVAITRKETTEESPVMTKSPSNESEAPSTSENMEVVGLILKKGLMDVCEENQQKERELQLLKTQSEPTGHKFKELRVHPSARVQEGNSKSRDYGTGSEGHWSWERQTQDRKKRVKKAVRFRDQHLPPEKLASLANEMSVSSGQFHYFHKGSRFSRTGGHSQYHPKQPLGGSFQRDSPGPSQYGVLWLPPRENNHPASHDTIGPSKGAGYHLC